MNPPKTEITEAVLFMPFTWGRNCFSLLLIRFLSLFVAKGCWFLSRLLSAFVFWFRSHQTTATISRKFFSDDGVNRLFCFLSGFSEKMVTYFCVNIRHRLFMENIFFLYKIYHGNSPVVETDFQTHTMRSEITSVTTSVAVVGWLQFDGFTFRELERAMPQNEELLQRFRNFLTAFPGAPCSIESPVIVYCKAFNVDFLFCRPSSSTVCPLTVLQR